MPYKNKELGKLSNKLWRQTKQGVLNERRRVGMKIPDEDLFWESWNRKNCELCGVSFSTKRKCVDHDHHSGYVRFICCNKCNCNIGSLDIKKMKLHLELYRYFHRI